MHTPTNVHGITGIGSPMAAGAVGERQAGGRRGDPEAFRRALRQHDGQAGEPGGERSPATPPDSRSATAAATASGLQPNGRPGRNNAETAARHIDVLA